MSAKGFAAILIGTVVSICGAQSRQAPSRGSSAPESTVLQPTASVRAPHRDDRFSNQARRQQFLQTPLAFEINQGQAPREYRFIAFGPSYSLGISRTGLALSLHRPAENHNHVESHPASATSSASVALSMVGSSPSSQVTGLDSRAGRSNYFLGNDSAQWRTNIPQFARVRIAAVYPGIDLLFHGNRQQLEYDFDVAPGADPDQIRLQARGAQAVTLDAQGNALLHTVAGDVELKRPVAYQEFAGNQHPVESSFQIDKAGLLRFHLGSYDRSRPLVIDPILLYSVNLGGSYGTTGIGLALDASGDVYVTGNTCSADFPSTAGNFQAIHTNPLADACEDGFVTKLDPTASTLIFSDFIGGADGASTGTHLAVDSSGNIYVAGATNATDFPTVSNIGTAAPRQCGLTNTGFDCPQGFILKLSPNGSQIVFSSLLGGSQASGAYQVGVNPATGDLDVLGGTNSSDFLPTPTTLETAFEGGSCGNGNPCFNGFLLGLDPSTGELRYGTFLGGQGNVWAMGLAFDQSGNIYITGSAQLPLSTSLGKVTNTYAPAGGVTASGTSLYVLKLNLSGDTLTPGYLTLVEGDADTGGSTLALDSSGDTYFGGGTSSLHLAVTSGAYQAANTDTAGDGCLWAPAVTPFMPASCGTGLVGKLSSAGALSFLTYLGGSSQTQIESLSLDSHQNLWLAGSTSSTNFPVTTGHYLVTPGYLSPFLAEMSNDGTQLPFATLVGGNSGHASSLAVDGSGNVYIAGYISNGLQTPNVYQTSFAGLSMAFVEKWGAGAAPSITLSTNSLAFNNTPFGAVSVPQTITIQNTSSVAAEIGMELASDVPGSATNFLESSTCGTSLAGGASCTVTVTFAPGTAPASCVPTQGCNPLSPTATLTIETNAIQGTELVSLSGSTGVAPAVVISPNPLVFSPQAAGTSSTPLLVDVSNLGDMDFVASSIVLSGPNAADFQLALSGYGANCTNPISPGSYCVVAVTFSPAASATGTRTATLTLTDDAPDSPQAVPITGTVIGASTVIVSPTIAAAGPVVIGTSKTTTVSVQNLSPNSIEVTSLAITGTNAGDFSANPLNCSANNALPMTVASGSSCTAVITFTPAAGASGLRTATLTVGTSPMITGLATVTLQGDALTNSQTSLSYSSFPNPMNFGGLEVGTSSNNGSVLLQINNDPPSTCGGGATTCGATLTISSITPGLSDYSVAVQPGNSYCTAPPLTIPALGGNCTFVVVFTPAQAGSRDTTLTVNSNDPQGPIQIPVFGSGLALPLGAFLQTALNFGNCAIGVACPALSTTLVNQGQGNLSISSVTASQYFTVETNSCPTSLAPQASCNISLTFTPPSAGFFTGTLTITDNGGLASQQSVTMTGSGATGPQLRLWPASVNFGNQTATTTSSPQTVEVASTGDSTVTLPVNGLFTTGDFILESTTCGTSLTAGSTCTASVQYRPSSAQLVGVAESGSLEATDNATGSPQIALLLGTPSQSTTAATTTTLTSSLNPATAGASILFTATVAGPSGNTTVPTGTVSFLNGTTTLGSGPLSASAAATFSTSTLPAGTYSITALYSGDSNFSGSTSNLVTQVVNAAAKASTTIVVTSSANPSTTGQPVTFTATVAGASGSSAAPTGSVTFMDGGTTLGSGTLNASGVATYSTSSLSTGSQSITAVYSGDSNFNGSTSGILTQMVNAAALLSTATALSSSVNPSAQGESVTFTATVTGPSGNTVTPTGSIIFMDGSTTLGTSPLNSSAQAAYTTSSLTTGTHSLTAVYGGDANFAGSTSAVLTQTVNGPGFALGLNPATVTLNAGQSGSTTVTVTPESGFDQSVSFACSGLPLASSCSFSPSTVTPNGSAVTTTLTIATDVAMTPLHAPSIFGGHGSAGSGILLACMLFGLGGIFRAGRRWRGFFAVLALFAVLGLALSGCGGNSSGAGSGTTTPSGSSTVTVTATAGSLSKSGTFTLVVQ